MMNPYNDKESGRSLLLKTGKAYVRIFVAEIVYCTARANYTYVHLLDGNTLVLKRSLISLEQELPARKFIRVHRSVLVHKKWVRKLSCESSLHAVLLNTEEVPVSRRKRGALLMSLC